MFVTTSFPLGKTPVGCAEIDSLDNNIVTLDNNIVQDASVAQYIFDIFSERQLFLVYTWSKSRFPQRITE